ncbi:MAG: flavin reductase [Phycisphaerales bacterium]|nr:flavin reductase [Phycisphaerales bacterium]
MPQASKPVHGVSVGALDLLPSGLYLLTAAFERARASSAVRYVQRCADHPPSLAVALPKGRGISVLIRDSHAFAVHVLPEVMLPLLRRAAAPAGEGEGEDALDYLEQSAGVTGAPVVTRARAAFECRVTMHLDFESDHELFIGEVVRALLR